MLLALIAAVWVLIGPGAAWAGCGCDHPPPAYAPVMPPFASPGTAITIFAVDEGAFRVGKKYKVDFGGSEVVKAVAGSESALEVTVPEKVAEDPGPKELHVYGQGYDHYYEEQLFTALPHAPVVPAGGGRFAMWKFFTAIDSGGTLLLPLDVSSVLDPSQFALHVTSFPLAFDQTDVAIYNADGVDLTLFTLDVDNPEQRQWGEYYGWRVEDDTGLYGDVYDPEVLCFVEPEKTSDLLGYWRHEFHSYAAAHAPGGTHQLDEEGRHPDGTMHVDHDHLVIAISGLERNPSDPTDVKPLDPGKFELDLVLTVTPSFGPMPQSEIREEVTQAVEAYVIERESGGPEGMLIPLD
jgi:hypothetical protein